MRTLSGTMKDNIPNTEWVSPTMRYVPLERLREKQSTATWRVQREDGRECTLECLRFADLAEWSDLERFERESEILKSISHPAVPRWLETFRHGDDLCIVSEALEGQTVRSLIASGRTLSAREIEDLLIQGLEILAHLHGQTPSIMHRDVSPDHVRVDTSSPHLRLILTGFGSARTSPGSGLSAVGTFGSMAPEQAIGTSVPASDLYSLGVTLLSLASHALPEDLANSEGSLRTDALSPLPERVRAVLTAMMERRLDDRLKTAKLGLDVLRGRAKVASVSDSPSTSGRGKLKSYALKLGLPLAALTAWFLHSRSLPEGARAAFRGHGHRIAKIVVNDQDVLASLDSRDEVHVYTESDTLASFNGDRALRVDDLALDPTGHHLLLCGKTGVVRLDVATHQRMVPFEGPCLAVTWAEHPLALLEDGVRKLRLLSADSGESVRTFELDPRCKTGDMKSHALAGATAVAVCLATHFSKDIGIVHISTPSGLRRLDFEGPIFEVALSADGRWLGVSQYAQVHLVEVATGDIKKTFPGMNGIALSRDGTRLALRKEGERKGSAASVSLLTPEDRELHSPIDGITANFEGMAWLRDAKTFATGGKDERVTFWEVP